MESLSSPATGLRHHGPIKIPLSPTSVSLDLTKGMHCIALYRVHRPVVRSILLETDIMLRFVCAFHRSLLDRHTYSRSKRNESLCLALMMFTDSVRLGSIPVTPDPNSSSKTIAPKKKKNNKDRSGRSHPRLNKFVRRLHDMLIREKHSGIVEWRRGLLVLFSTDAFSKRILPKYFNTRNFKTFRRQVSSNASIEEMM